MDALKKAEQEKRDAARKLEESAPPAADADSTDQRPATPGPKSPPSGPRELSLTPVSGEFATPSEAADSGTPAVESALAGDLPTLNVTGERLYSMELNTSQPEVIPAAPSPSGLAGELIAEEGFDGDKTFQGVQADAVPRAIPGMFEETVRGDLAGSGEAGGYDQTLPGVSALQMARDIGTRDQPTPVAAETVFVAGRSREDPGSGIKWVLSGLTLLMLAAAGVWVYFTVTPVARNVPSPLVARGIESVPAPRGESAFPAGGTMELPGAVPVEGVAPPTPPGTAATVERTAQIPIATADSPEIAGASPGPKAAVEATTPAAGPEPAPGPVPAEPVAAPTPPAPIAATAMAASAPSLVRISRTAGPRDEERMVREAYELYQAGDLTGARAVYFAVLNESPDNLDALLGIGAIALRQGETGTAVQFHGRVLRLDPANKTALAVLVGLNKSADIGGAESAVNTLIQENPEQPFLYFTLGGIYAAQQRWPEAQQAFFEAHRTDSSNPDYALNLAVSLDRIGQRQAALDYYNTALRLGEQRPAGFDPAAVLARIQSLSGAATP